MIKILKSIYAILFTSKPKNSCKKEFGLEDGIVLEGGQVIHNPGISMWSISCGEYKDRTYLRRTTALDVDLDNRRIFFRE